VLHLTAYWLLPTSYWFHPCFCLCFGFSQMIYTRRPRLMTLHFSHLTFTDARTFIPVSSFPVYSRSRVPISIGIGT